jgi:NADH-quinone oxidoreductase subunit G
VELCPVGALTSKIYSFKYRAWDSQYYEASDFSDSLCSSIRIFTNLNKIIRILPQYDETMNWSFLTEKSRFLYDGLNIQRIKFPAIKNFDFNISKLNCNYNKYYYSISWEKLKKFLMHFYSNFFINNLAIINKKKLFFKLKPIIGNLIDIEIINYLRSILVVNEQSIFLNATDNLLLTSFRESFLNYDFRDNYILKKLNFNDYNVCLLLNLNLRFENPLLNAKVRQDYIWNNLLIYSFGSKYDLTYKYYQLGNNTKSFLKFVKGQTLLNNIFTNIHYKPVILVSSNLMQQYDNIYYRNFFSFLKNKFNISFEYICNSSARTGSIDLVIILELIQLIILVCLLS